MKKGKKITALILTCVLLTVASSQAFAKSVTRSDNGYSVTATLDRNSSGASASTSATNRAGVLVGITISFYEKENPNKQYTTGDNEFREGYASVSPSVSSSYYCYKAKTTHSCPKYAFNESLSD